MANYEVFYNKIYTWFTKPETKRLQTFKFIYKTIPYITVLVYGLLILYVVFILRDLEKSLKVIGVPFVAFVTVSIMRKVFNKPRPYTKYKITPLIQKEKTGESFPSRHVVSITIIAMAALYINIYLGMILLVFSAILAALRVIAGVHFVKDVVFGAIISVILGILGFYYL